MTNKSVLTNEIPPPPLLDGICRCDPDLLEKDGMTALCPECMMEWDEFLMWLRQQDGLGDV